MIWTEAEMRKVKISDRAHWKSVYLFLEENCLFKTFLLKYKFLLISFQISGLQNLIIINIKIPSNACLHFARAVL